ncbi:hypothetical protein N8T08_010772 [Aspergillus melleus]|uniref:Uncharacterized protein n=1 Tax=Aspergillus melleus TaxID=138277 RepID=A0ACC3BC21_9EURO|nr:hypothetical protein N8T08_010772 [Aspergillus melleus]
MGNSKDAADAEHETKTEPVEVPVDVESSQTDPDPPGQYLTGLRLHLVTAALCMCLFLTNLEIPIVVTSIVSITSDIGGQDKVYWIIASYMIGYVVLIFIVFSGACGGSQNIEQLIVFRAFQGVGGAGNYSLCAAVVLELVPPEKYASYTSGMSVVYAISLLLGPIFGGAISESAWRWVFLLKNSICLGGTWFVAIFQLPQRFQFVNGLSPLQAGIRFIPFTVAAPVGSVLAPVLAKIFKLPLVYLVLVASLIQVVAYALLGTLSESVHMAAAQYGYQVLAGFGCGINITLLILMTPFTVEERDKAVAMGAVAQFRVMGGAICLAIVTAASQGYLQSHLSHLLNSQQVHDILNSTDALSEFSEATQEAIRATYSGSYNLQMKILIAFAGGQVLSTACMWKRNQLTV